MLNSKSFKRSEFACKCGCGFDTVDAELLEKLELLRSHFEKPVTVTSGCRCPSHNRAVGGSPNSQHLYGRAADIVVEDTAPSIVAEYLDTLHVGGLGLYDTFTHVDTRVIKARW